MHIIRNTQPLDRIGVPYLNAPAVRDRRCVLHVDVSERPPSEPTKSDAALAGCQSGADVRMQSSAARFSINIL